MILKVKVDRPHFLCRILVELSRGQALSYVRTYGRTDGQTDRRSQRQYPFGKICMTGKNNKSISYLSYQPHCYFKCIIPCFSIKKACLFLNIAITFLVFSDIKVPLPPWLSEITSANVLVAGGCNWDISTPASISYYLCCNYCNYCNQWRIRCNLWLIRCPVTDPICLSRVT